MIEIEPESTLVGELAEGLVRLGSLKTVSRQRRQMAYDALAGQSPTDEAILLQALKNR